MKDMRKSTPGARRLAATLGSIMCSMATAPASAYYYGVRFVERVGGSDLILGDSVTFLAGSTHRLRVQFGLFDDAAGPAPADGFVGWNSGSFDANFGSWARTPGRLDPFTFSQSPYSNGVPQTDPFTHLEQIDNVIGSQALLWNCGPDGMPLPPPPPVIYGHNDYVSTFEATVTIPSDLEGPFQVAIGGNLIGLREWHYDPRLSAAPNCETGEPGYAFYIPLTLPAHEFTYIMQVNVIVPGPGTAACILAAIARSTRRARRSTFRDSS